MRGPLAQPQCNASVPNGLWNGVWDSGPRLSHQCHWTHTKWSPRHICRDLVPGVPVGAVFVSLCSLRGCSGGLQHAEEATDRPLQPTAHLAHGPGGALDRRRPDECSDSWCVPGSSVSHDALLRTGVGLWADSVCSCHVLHPSPCHPLTLLLDDLPERPGQDASVVHLRGGDCCGICALCCRIFGSAMQPQISPDQSLHLLALLSVHMCSCDLCCSKKGLCHNLSFPTDTARWLLINGMAICSRFGMVFFYCWWDFCFFLTTFCKGALSQVLFTTPATVLKCLKAWHSAYENGNICVVVMRFWSHAFCVVEKPLPGIVVTQKKRGCSQLRSDGTLMWLLHWWEHYPAIHSRHRTVELLVSFCECLVKTVLLRVIRFVSAWHRATANRNRGFLKLELVIWWLWLQSKSAPFGVSAESTGKVQWSISRHGSTAMSMKTWAIMWCIVAHFPFIHVFHSRVKFSFDISFFYHIFICHWWKILIALLSGRSPLLVVAFLCWGILWWSLNYLRRAQCLYCKTVVRCRCIRTKCAFFHAS